MQNSEGLWRLPSARTIDMKALHCKAMVLLALHSNTPNLAGHQMMDKSRLDPPHRALCAQDFGWC